MSSSSDNSRDKTLTLRAALVLVTFGAILLFVRPKDAPHNKDCGNSEHKDPEKEHPASSVVELGTIDKPDGHNKRHHGAKKTQESWRLRHMESVAVIFATVTALATFGYFWKSVADNTASVRLERRAWVTVHNTEAQPIVVGEPISVKIIVGNSGQTPARDVIFTEGALAGAQPCGAHEHTTRVEGASRFVIAPGSDYPQMIQSDQIVGASQIKQIEGGASFFAFGVITYKDIFDVVHTSQFCVVYNIKSYLATKNPLGWCSCHNDAR